MADAASSNPGGATSAFQPDSLNNRAEANYPEEEFRMGGRTRETFNKRQKERARQEKQRDKLAKRQQRKSERPEGAAPDDNIDWSAANDSLDSDNPLGDEA